MPLKALKEWTVKKATRDFEDKIRFDDVRERVRGRLRADYDAGAVSLALEQIDGVEIGGPVGTGQVAGDVDEGRCGVWI
jgi:hypothetical protein